MPIRFEPFLDVEPDRLAARECVLRLLSLAASDPAAERFARVREGELARLACAAARHLAELPELVDVELAPGEALPADLDILPLAQALAAPRAQLSADHARVYGLVVSKECPPYELQYCPQTFSVHRSQLLADISGFYRAFGLTPGRDAPERGDHLACELEFQTWLVAKERYARAQAGPEWPERAESCRAAQRRFAEEHLAWWIPAFAHALERRVQALEAPPALHSTLARALPSWVATERALLGVAPPEVLAQPRSEEPESADACTGCT